MPILNDEIRNKFNELLNWYENVFNLSKKEGPFDNVKECIDVIEAKKKVKAIKDKVMDIYYKNQNFLEIANHAYYCIDEKDIYDACRQSLRDIDKKVYNEIDDVIKDGISFDKKILSINSILVKNNINVDIVKNAIVNSIKNFITFIDKKNLGQYLTNERISLTNEMIDDLKNEPSIIENQKKSEFVKNEKIINTYLDHPDFKEIQSVRDAFSKAKIISTTVPGESTYDIVNLENEMNNTVKNEVFFEDIGFLSKQHDLITDLNVTQDDYDFLGKDVETRARFAKKYSNNLDISKESKELILKVFEGITDLGLKNNLEYLQKAKQVVEDKVAKEDIDGVIKWVEDYNNQEQKVDEVFNNLKLLGDDDGYAVGKSLVTYTDIPSKYRNDIKNGSNYNVIRQLLIEVNNLGYDYKYLINNPQEVIKKYFINKTNNKSINSFIENNSTNDILRSVITKDNKFNDLCSEIENEGKDNFLENLQSISCLLKGKEKIKFRASVKLFTKAIVNDLDIDINKSFKDEDKQSYITRIIALDPNELNVYSLLDREMIDPHTLQPRKKFDLIEYVKNNSPKKIIQRMANVVNGDIGFASDDISNAIVSISTALLNSKEINLTDEEWKTLNVFKNKEFDKIAINDVEGEKSVYIRDVGVLEKLNNFYDELGKIEKQTKNLADVEIPSEYEESFEVKYKLDATIERFANNILNMFKSVSEVESLALRIGMKQEDIDHIVVSAFSNIYPNKISQNSMRSITLKDNKTQARKELFNLIVSDEPELLDKANDIVRKSLIRDIKRDYCRLTNTQSVKSFVQMIGPSYDILNASIPNIKDIPNSRDYEIENSFSTLEEETNYLREQNINNQDVVKLLDNVEELVRRPSNNVLHIRHGMAEKMSEKACMYALKNEMKFLNENIGDDFYKVSVISIDIPEYSNRTKAIKKLSQIDYQLKGERKANILSILNEIKSGEFKSDYSQLTTIVDSMRGELTKKEGCNLKTLNELYLQYLEVEKKTDDLMDKIRINSDKNYFNVNNSVARVTSVPAKYRHDIATSTIYRTLVTFNDYINDFNKNKEDVVTIDEIVDNPFKASIKFYKNRLKNTVVSTQYNLLSPAKIMKKLSEEDTDVVKENTDLSREVAYFNNGITAIGYLLDEKERAKLGAFVDVLSTSIVHGLQFSCMGIKNDVNAGENILFELIVKEQKDRDVYALTTDYIDLDTFDKHKFDAASYISTNTTIGKVTGRLLETINDDIGFTSNEKNLMCSHVAQKLSSLNLNGLTKVNKQILNYIKNNDYKSIPAFTLRAFEIEEQMAKNEKENYQNTSLADEVDKLTELENIYNSRGFFNQWFGSDTKALFATINNLRSSIERHNQNKPIQQLRDELTQARNRVENVLPKGNDQGIPVEVDDAVIDNDKYDNELQEELYGKKVMENDEELIKKDK